MAIAIPFSSSNPEGISLEVRYILGVGGGGVPRQFAELWFTTDGANEGESGREENSLLLWGEGIEGGKRKGWLARERRAGPPRCKRSSLSTY